MDPLTSAAASGMRARMESLDMLANNLANASSAGYKLDREFYSLYAAAEAQADNGADTQVLPLVDRPWTDFSQGVLQPTAKPLDIALEGKGFFAVSGPSGPLYTRAGNFHISRAGVVVSQEGYPLQLKGGRPLAITSAEGVEISPDGSVSQNGQALGQLEVVDFPNADVLQKVGSNYFQTAGRGVTPSPSKAAIHQRSLENSNVNSAQSAVQLVGVMRQFEMLQKAISLGSDMNRKVVEEVAKV
jgi:flagellar basal-body rod protein FlgF